MGHPLTWLPIVRGEGMLYICLAGLSPIKDGESSHVNFQNPKSIRALKKSTTQSGNMMFLVTMVYYGYLWIWHR